MKENNMNVTSKSFLNKIYNYVEFLLNQNWTFLTKKKPQIFYKPII